MLDFYLIREAGYNGCSNPCLQKLTSWDYLLNNIDRRYEKPISMPLKERWYLGRKQNPQTNLSDRQSSPSRLVPAASSRPCQTPVVTDPAP